MKHPNFLDFQKTFNKQIIKGHYAAIILFINSDSDLEVEKFEEAAIIHKKNYKHYVISDKSNKETQLYKDLTKSLDIKENEKPFIIYCLHTMDFHFIKYKFTGVINKFNINSWIDNIKKE